MELEDWRKKIDALNIQLVEILNQRARCALGIAKLKKNLHLPIHDPKRESEVLANVLKHSQGPLSDAAFTRIFSAIMEEHRKLEDKD